MAGRVRRSAQTQSANRCLMWLRAISCKPHLTLTGREPELSIGMCSDERQASPLAGLTEACWPAARARRRACWRTPTRSDPAVLDDARMVLIGQAPGPVTDRKGVPLRRASGSVPVQLAGPRGLPAELLSRARLPDLADALLSGQIGFGQRRSAAIGGRDRPVPSLPGVGALVRSTCSVVLLVGKMAIDAFLGKQPLDEDGRAGLCSTARACTCRCRTPAASRAG